MVSCLFLCRFSFGFSAQSIVLHSQSVASLSVGVGVVDGTRYPQGNLTLSLIYLSILSTVSYTRYVWVIGVGERHDVSVGVSASHKEFATD